ncbi:UPF0524 protein C3orf70 homolog [Athene cunicularia]|uniref:UPF0524 protein C3orf70 homolog n=1 Tax=Athene cunicularia TaxID=194338 RepID=UPI000EF732C0|nr:UPF0524 protein C3orf70 homolog [Athene cunicularia]
MSYRCLRSRGRERSSTRERTKHLETTENGAAADCREPLVVVNSQGAASCHQFVSNLKITIFKRCLSVFPTGKYVYQPMTPVEQLPSTEIPVRPRESTNTIQISVSLTEHFLKFAPVFQPPLPPDSPQFCTIADLFIDNYRVKCINGKMCYVQRQPPPLPHKIKPEEVPVRNALITKESNTPKPDHCSSPSSSEDSGINAVGVHYMESCDEDTEGVAELSSEEDYSPDSSWEPDECPLLSPSQCEMEVIETIETTV